MLKNLLCFSIEFLVILVPGGSILEVFKRSGTQRHLQRAEGLPGSSPETSQASQKEPREAQETPKGNPREPKTPQENPKRAQRLPKGVQKDVGGAPKHKKGDLQQTSLLIVFELHKGDPGPPGDGPKSLKA